MPNLTPGHTQPEPGTPKLTLRHAQPRLGMFPTSPGNMPNLILGHDSGTRPTSPRDMRNLLDLGMGQP